MSNTEAQTIFLSDYQGDVFGIGVNRVALNGCSAAKTEIQRVIDLPLMMVRR
jgi:hypothetical protein